MTIWRMRVACWITNTTDTHPEYVILTASLGQQRSHERASLLRHTVCPVFSCHTSIPLALALLRNAQTQNVVCTRWANQNVRQFARHNMNTYLSPNFHRHLGLYTTTPAILPFLEALIEVCRRERDYYLLRFCLDLFSG